jgi:hypothetical protein
MLSFVDMKRSPVERALAPFQFIVAIALVLVLGLLGAGVVQTIWGSGSVLGLGESSACVLATPTALESVNTHVHVVGLHPHTSAHATQVEVCAAHPSGEQRLLGAAASVPEFLYVLGFLGLTWMLLQLTRRVGLFAPEVARGVGRLGLYVLTGTLVVAVLAAAASAQLLTTMTAIDGTGLFLQFFHISWAVLFAGFGMLTIGRALTQAAIMQREIDATV